MTGDYHALASAMSNLKTYFIINGVITLLGIFISFLSICVLLVLPMLGIIPYLLDPSNF